MKYCSAGAVGLWLGPRVELLRAALANPAAPIVIWLKGSSCDGCSISLLNRIADTGPKTVTEILTSSVNLIYHANVMSFAGEPAVAGMRQAYNTGNYILVVEGGIPTAFGGHACVDHSYKGVESTFQETVMKYASRASHVVCAGTCAAWGGIPAAGSNPTHVVGVKELTGITTVNIAGCPANPDWLVWPIVQLLTGGPIVLDSVGRPVDLYQNQGTIHDKCPRRTNGLAQATDFGEDGHCLMQLGCRGPSTYSRCENCWNGKAGSGHWCVGVNAPCHGCVEPTFPGTGSFYTAI